MNSGLEHEFRAESEGQLSYKWLPGSSAFFFSLFGPFCRTHPDPRKVSVTSGGSCSVEKFSFWAEEGAVCSYQGGKTCLTHLGREIHGPSRGGLMTSALGPQLQPYLRKSVKHSICYYLLNSTEFQLPGWRPFGHLHCLHQGVGTQAGVFAGWSVSFPQKAPALPTARLLEAKSLIRA